MGLRGIVPCDNAWPLRYDLGEAVSPIEVPILCFGTLSPPLVRGKIGYKVPFAMLTSRSVACESSLKDVCEMNLTFFRAFLITSSEHMGHFLLTLLSPSICLKMHV